MIIFLTVKLNDSIFNYKSLKWLHSLIKAVILSEYDCTSLYRLQLLELMQLNESIPK